VILFTSNLGVRESAQEQDLEMRSEIILNVVKATLRPEIYNRISQVVCFNSLTEPELEKILLIHLGKLKKKLNDDRNIDLRVSPAALAFLAKESYDPTYGARPVPS
jgi:ATP-dependent Clp protease ATP-binding subunit ClpB